MGEENTDNRFNPISEVTSEKKSFLSTKHNFATIPSVSLLTKPSVV